MHRSLENVMKQNIKMLGLPALPQMEDIYMAYTKKKTMPSNKTIGEISKEDGRIVANTKFGAVELYIPGVQDGSGKEGSAERGRYDSADGY